MSVVSTDGRLTHPVGRSPRNRHRRLAGLGWAGVLVLLIGWSMRGAGFNARFLSNARAQHETRRFVDGFLHPDLRLTYLADVAHSAVTTLQISFAGLAVGAVIGVPLSFLAAANLAANRTPGLPRWRRVVGLVPYQLARNTLNFLRAVPELVWALVFISAVGLGPFAGSLAIGLHSAGLLGKLWAEQMEAVDDSPVEAVRLLGAGRTALGILAVFPQARQNLLSLTLYQWECNVRAAAIVGFVGAGGIGQDLDVSIRLFRYSQASVLILAILILVALADGTGALIRRSLR